MIFSENWQITDDPSFKVSKWPEAPTAVPPPSRCVATMPGVTDARRHESGYPDERTRTQWHISP